MISNRPMYIHVGYGKTATSWMQEKIFLSNPDIDFLGKTNEWYPDWLLNVNYLDEIAYEKEKNQIKKYIQSLIDQSTKKICLVSSEAFTNFGYLKYQAKRIKDLFPNPKILLVIRNPIHLIESFYKFNVKQGHFFLNLDYYLDWSITPFVLQKRPPIYLTDLMYDEIIEYYYALFGKKNVLWLTYETFQDDPNSFFQQVGHFMNLYFEDVSEIAKDIILKSISSSEMIELRKENYLKMMKKMGVKNPPQTITYESGPIISMELKSKLIQFFKPKCSMYNF